MNLQQFPQFHGRTLAEIAAEYRPRPDGYAVFQIWDVTDPLGDEVGIGISVADIIRDHPEVADWVVKYTNDYMGMIVLRVADPGRC